MKWGFCCLVFGENTETPKQISSVVIRAILVLVLSVVMHVCFYVLYCHAAVSHL